MRLNTLVGAGPDKIGIDDSRKRYIDRYTKDLGECKSTLHLRFDALTIQNSHQIRLDGLYTLLPNARLHDHDAQVSQAIQRIKGAKSSADRYKDRLTHLSKGNTGTSGGYERSKVGPENAFDISSLGKKVDEGSADKGSTPKPGRMSPRGFAI